MSDQEYEVRFSEELPAGVRVIDPSLVELAKSPAGHLAFRFKHGWILINPMIPSRGRSGGGLARQHGHMSGTVTHGRFDKSADGKIKFVPTHSGPSLQAWTAGHKANAAAYHANRTEKAAAAAKAAKEVLVTKAGAHYAAGISDGDPASKAKSLKHAADLAHQGGHPGLKAKALSGAANVTGTPEDHRAAAQALQDVATAQKAPVLADHFQQKADQHAKAAQKATADQQAKAVKTSQQSAAKKMGDLANSHSTAANALNSGDAPGDVKAAEHAKAAQAHQAAQKAHAAAGNPYVADAHGLAATKHEKAAAKWADEHKQQASAKSKYQQTAKGADDATSKALNAPAATAEARHAEAQQGHQSAAEWAAKAGLAHHQQKHTHQANVHAEAAAKAKQAKAVQDASDAKAKAKAQAVQAATDATAKATAKTVSANTANASKKVQSHLLAAEHHTYAEKMHKAAGDQAAAATHAAKAAEHTATSQKLDKAQKDKQAAQKADYNNKAMAANAHSTAAWNASGPDAVAQHKKAEQFHLAAANVAYDANMSLNEKQHDDAAKQHKNMAATLQAEIDNAAAQATAVQVVAPAKKTAAKPVGKKTAASAQKMALSELAKVVSAPQFDHAKYQAAKDAAKKHGASENLIDSVVDDPHSYIIGGSSAPSAPSAPSPSAPSAKDQALSHFAIAYTDPDATVFEMQAAKKAALAAGATPDEIKAVSKDPYSYQSSGPSPFAPSAPSAPAAPAVPAVKAKDVAMSDFAKALDKPGVSPATPDKALYAAKNQALTHGATVDELKAVAADPEKYKIPETFAVKAAGKWTKTQHTLTAPSGATKDVAALKGAGDLHVHKMASGDWKVTTKDGVGIGGQTFTTQAEAKLAAEWVAKSYTGQQPMTKASYLAWKADHPAEFTAYQDALAHKPWKTPDWKHQADAISAVGAPAFQPSGDIFQDATAMKALYTQMGALGTPEAAAAYHAAKTAWVSMYGSSYDPHYAANAAPAAPVPSGLSVGTADPARVSALTQKQFASSHAAGYRVMPDDENANDGWVPSEYGPASGPYIYSTGKYTPINKQLRSGSGATGGAWDDTIAKLDQAFAEVPPMDYKVVTSRKMDDSGPFPDAPPPMTPGATYMDTGFGSTGKSRDTWSGSVHMEVRIPVGAKAIDLNYTTGSAHESENEILLPRNTKYRIVSDGRSTWGHEGEVRHIVVEVVV